VHSGGLAPATKASHLDAAAFPERRRIFASGGTALMDTSDGSRQSEAVPHAASLAGYTLERELGRGGMATVYLARDRKHDRLVAVKVLHPELAAVVGVERFLQEIRVTAHLQHPHILGLIDSGVFGDDAGAFRGRPYYVMPYVEGESLRARLTREGQLAVAEALRIAKEVARALDHAHRRGVVHRDIKPENVLLAEDGQALVADFGIALAVRTAGGERITQTGVSLGTPAYMSPEQVTGDRHISPRADIYALGAMTYEMLAGEPPFTGHSAQAVIARVMTEEPRSLSIQRRSVPPTVDAAVHTALEKLPADRFMSAAEFARALETVAPVTDTYATSPVLPRRRIRAVHLAAAALAGAAVAALVALALLRRSGDTTSLPPLRATLLPPEGESFVGGDGMALSADGTQLAFTVLRASPMPRLFVRRLATGVMRELAGTADARFPFWSADGRMLGFFANGELRVVSAAGGPVSVVTRVAVPLGGAWALDGTIIYAGEPNGVIYRVRTGSAPVAVTKRGHEGSHERPMFLPDGHHFVFSATGRTGVFISDVRTGEQRRILPEGDAAMFAAPGHLIFETTGTFAYGRLMALPFDPDRGTVSGEPKQVVDSVFNPSGFVGYTVSATGLLLYQEKFDMPARMWLDRHGVVLDSVPHDASWTFRLSHAGTRVAQGGFAVWVRDLRRGVALQLPVTSGSLPTVQVWPVWSPDDARVAYTTPTSEADRPAEIRVARADGTGVDTQLSGPLGGGRPLDWSPDGSTLLVSGSINRTTAALSLWITSVATRKSTQWLASAGEIPFARFSPDGGWVAYQSNETGAPEVYVRPFPGPGPPIRVSPAGGGRPAWRADGRELFYLTPAGDLMAAPISPARPLEVGTPRLLFRGVSREPYSMGVEPYDASPDGQRFLLNAENRAPAPPFTLLAPWRLALARDAR
jgi:serine/threonine-protein kinase